MNFHDKVYELVKAFKETEEYTEYLRLKEEIKQDVDKYQMLKDFKEKQKEMQIIYINGGKIEEEKQKEMQNLYSIVIQNESVRKLLEYEMKLDVLLADMQKIMAEAIKEIIEF